MSFSSLASPTTLTSYVITANLKSISLHADNSQNDTSDLALSPEQIQVFNYLLHIPTKRHRKLEMSKTEFLFFLPNMLHLQVYAL